MKILQLCKKFPYPLKDGESMAVTFLARALHQQGCEISLLAMNTSKHWVDVPRNEVQLSHYQDIKHVELDNQVKPLHAFLDLFSTDSYNISRFHISDFEEVLKSTLSEKSFDVIQLESLYLTPYLPVIRACTEAKVVLRAHNVEHEIWELMASNESGALRRWYFDFLARKLKNYEKAQLSQIDLLLPISSQDARTFGRLGYVGASCTLPIGIDLGQFEPAFPDAGKPMSLSFIGSLDWMPNVDALNFFLDAIWPHLLSAFPELTFHVAGRNCPDWLKRLEVKQVIIHGEVPDAQAFVRAHPFSIVPLRSGSGMKVKVLEAMALGKVVIASDVALAGIDVAHKQQVLIANNLRDYIDAFRYCSQDATIMTQMGQSAHQFVREHHDYLKVARPYLEKVSQSA